eukprot:SAG11_NODE_143_length_14870_cov_6.472412_9_plen_62_part_00
MTEVFISIDPNPFIDMWYLFAGAKVSGFIAPRAHFRQTGRGCMRDRLFLPAGEKSFLWLHA